METLGMWNNIIRGENANILPYRGKADLQLDSSLIYDIPVLKDQAMPLFKKAMEEGCLSPEETEIISMIGLFPSVSADCVRQDSLMREFIG